MEHRPGWRRHRQPARPFPRRWPSAWGSLGRSAISDAAVTRGASSSNQYTYASWLDRARHPSTTRAFPTNGDLRQTARADGFSLERWRARKRFSVSVLSVVLERYLVTKGGLLTRRRNGDEKQSCFEPVRSKPSLDGRNGHDSLRAERPGARHVGVVPVPITTLGPRCASTPGRRVTH
jgi:hypothetical protein